MQLNSLSSSRSTAGPAPNHDTPPPAMLGPAGRAQTGEPARDPARGPLAAAGLVRGNCGRAGEGGNGSHAAGQRGWGYLGV